jgi:capsular exopolysaccharide synthesis family protein
MRDPFDDTSTRARASTTRSEVQFTDVVAVMWRRRWLVALMVLVSVGLSAAFAFSQPKRYESTATLALTPDVQRGQGFVASDNLAALLGTYAATARGTVNLQRAASILGRSLPGTVKTHTKSGTGILKITGRSSTPKGAADTARATADAFRTSIRGNRLLVADLVDPAVPPTKPVQPRPALIMGVAGLIGLLAGALLAFAAERFRRRIETPADLGQVTDAPLIGRIPRSRRHAHSPPDVVWTSARTVALQESYRALRTNVEFLTERSDTVLLLTSPGPGEGKSTLVANLAVALGQVGIDTTVVDADLRAPQQHRIFDVDNSAGLSTLMTSARADFTPRPTRFPHVSVVPSGPAPADVTEMLHIRLKGVLEDLRQSGATILVDGPPVLPVSDASLIAAHSDGVIVLVAARLTKFSAMRSSLARLELAGARLLGIVLSQSGAEFEEADGLVPRYRAPSSPPPVETSHEG